MVEQQMNIAQRSAALEKAPTFAGLFKLTLSNGPRPAACYVEDGREITITYAQYGAMARSYGAYLQRTLGIPEPGVFAAIALDTCPQWFPAFWGLLMAGYNVLLVDFSLADDRLAYLLAQAGATAVITAKERGLPGRCRQVLIQDLCGAPQADCIPAFGQQVALCTSGTTATSRVFTYDARAVCAQVLNSRLLYERNRRMISDDCRRALAFLPFHHVFGFMVCLLWIGFIGYTNVFLPDRSPKTIMETCRRFKVQLLVTVPLLANNLSAGVEKKLASQSAFKQKAFKAMEALSLGIQGAAPSLGLAAAKRLFFRRVTDQLLGPDIQCIILGGSHTPREHLRTLAALGYYTVCGFGMTETAITSLETELSLKHRLDGSVGKPLTSAEYRVIPDGTDPSRGELAICGRTLHTGRMVDGVLVPPDRDDQGFYRTGDVVSFREGRLYIEGRLKDVIVNESGENVYPDELEDAFSRLPGVEQLCVLGLDRQVAGTAYEAINLVVNVGQRMTDGAFLNQLASQATAINAGLPVFKRVARMLAVGSPLPTANGIKVKRAALKALLAQNQLPFKELSVTDQSRPMAPEDALAAIREKVREIYAQALDMPKAQIGDNDHFLEDLGGDSLQVLSIATQVEEQFSVLIPTEDYGRCTTVNEMAQLLYEELYDIHRSRAKTPGEVKPITRFEDTPEYQAFAARQAALMKENSDNPYFVCHDSPLTDVSVMAGETVLNFGSYNYVGMSGRREVQEAAQQAIAKYGTSASGSRLLAGEKSLYQELERELADWKHAEDCLVLVGGHSTNVTIVGNFCGENDLILYDALAHNSIEQGCRLSRAAAKPFPHNDAQALERILKVQRSRFEKVLIVIEGAYSMDGDIADVPAFVKLKKAYGCFLMVDEAHSACVIGPTGGGVDEYFHLAPDDIDIKMGTLSKGLGACGGYLAGSRALITYLRYNLPGFVFSVGISPPLAAAVLTAVRLLRRDPTIMARMARNIRLFSEEARKRGLNICLAGETAIIPVMVGSDEDAFRLSNAMRSRGVFVPPAVYPAVPRGKARLRFCVISEHRPEQIVKALDTLMEAAADLGIALTAS